MAGSAAPAFTIVKPEQVRGVGMRGSQAVLDTWAGNQNVQLVAIGELFQDRLDGGIANLKQKSPRQFAKKFKVDPEHMFPGFDAYKKVLASDIDILMICTPPAYHPMHFIAAVEARKHIFCEKPFGADPVNVRKLMEAARKAEELKLVVISRAQPLAHKQYRTPSPKPRPARSATSSPRMPTGPYAAGRSGGETESPQHRRDRLGDGRTPGERDRFGRRGPAAAHQPRNRGRRKHADRHHGARRPTPA